MRALKTDGSSISLVDSANPPTAQPGEAIVKPARVLVTAADLNAATGGTFQGVLGSQFVGVIKSINMPEGAGASLASRKGWVGKRVVGTPALPCTSCDLCRGGLSAHCRARTVLGVWQRDGALAEAVSVPLASLSLVPDPVNDDAAVFAHQLASALHAANMLRSEQSSFITVLGDSTMAILTAQVLTRMNKTVRLLTSKPDRQKLCERWGIKHRGVDEPGRRQDQDVVVDCTGSSAGLRLALQFVRPRGVVLLKSDAALAPFPPGRVTGAPKPGTSYAEGVDLTPAIVNEVQILGSRDGPMPDALRMLGENGVDVASLIAQRVKLVDAAGAMTANIGRDALGLLVEC